MKQLLQALRMGRVELAEQASHSCSQAVPDRAGRGSVEGGEVDMTDMVSYKGYFGSVHYDDADRIFYGKMEFIRALVSYEGTDAASLRSALEEAVDDYLAISRTCQ
jgi:hypothetical protein